MSSCGRGSPGGGDSGPKTVSCRRDTVTPVMLSLLLFQQRSLGACIPGFSPALCPAGDTVELGPGRKPCAESLCQSSDFWPTHKVRHLGGYSGPSHQTLQLKNVLTRCERKSENLGERMLPAASLYTRAGVTAPSAI